MASRRQSFCTSMTKMKQPIKAVPPMIWPLAVLFRMPLNATDCCPSYYQTLEYVHMVKMVTAWRVYDCITWVVVLTCVGGLGGRVSHTHCYRNDCMIYLPQFLYPSIQRFTEGLPSWYQWELVPLALQVRLLQWLHGCFAHVINTTQLITTVISAFVYCIPDHGATITCDQTVCPQSGRVD